LRLANSVGIIDSGYRGELIAVFDYAEYYDISKYSVTKFTKLVQVCAPSLVPIYVEVVTSLGDMTTRGEGGFGSTDV
jgi:dUTP pyrophosphatase